MPPLASSSWTLAALTLALLAGCAGSTPPQAAPAAAEQVVATAGVGKVKGVITTDGIGYGVAAVGGQVVAGALVYLDGLPDIRTLSDANGAFELTGVPTGRQYLVAQKQTSTGLFKLRAALDLSAEQPLADLSSLVVRQTGSITGLVTLNGKAADALGTDVFVAGSTLVGKSKASGGYALAAVAAGTYQVTASRNGFTPLTQTIVVKAGQSSSLNFDLKPAPAEATSTTATLTGTVKRANGQPLANAMVSLRGGGPSTLTDDAGNYALSGVPNGSAEVQVYSPGFQVRAVARAVAVDPKDPKSQALSLAPLTLVPDSATAPPAVPLPAVVAAAAATAADAVPPAAVDGGGTSAASDLPGVLDQHLDLPGGEPQTTTLGLTIVGSDTYAVSLAQGFVPTKTGHLTAFAASLSSGDLAVASDTEVSIHAADDSGMPVPEVLGTATIAASRLQKFGLNNPYTAAVFSPAVPVKAGQRYLAVVDCKHGQTTWLLTNKPTPGQALRISFAAVGNTAWLWKPLPENQGFNFGVFRTYMAP